MLKRETDHRAFYNKYVADGGEGVVLKNMMMPYILTDSRRRNTQVKLKRNMGEQLGQDIDAFITGFVKATEGRGWEDMIGAIELSVFLRDEDGNEAEHLLARIPAMSLELRREMSETGPNGKPQLKEEYYGRVVSINGQDISSRSKRFAHAIADWNKGFRNDKTRHDCVLEKSFLDTQIF